MLDGIQTHPPSRIPCRSIGVREQRLYTESYPYPLNCCTRHNRQVERSQARASSPTGLGPTDALTPKNCTVLQRVRQAETRGSELHVQGEERGEEGSGSGDN